MWHVQPSWSISPSRCPIQCNCALWHTNSGIPCQTPMRKNDNTTKIYMIWRLYNLRMREYDSIMADLNHIRQHHLLLVLPRQDYWWRVLCSCIDEFASWELFVTKICNMFVTNITCASSTASILSENLSFDTDCWKQEGRAAIIMWKKKTIEDPRRNKKEAIEVLRNIRCILNDMKRNTLLVSLCP